MWLLIHCRIIMKTEYQKGGQHGVRQKRTQVSFRIRKLHATALAARLGRLQRELQQKTARLSCLADLVKLCPNSLQPKASRVRIFESKTRKKPKGPYPCLRHPVVQVILRCVSVFPIAKQRSAAALYGGALTQTDPGPVSKDETSWLRDQLSPFSTHTIEGPEEEL